MLSLAFFITLAAAGGDAVETESTVPGADIYVVDPKLSGLTESMGEGVSAAIGQAIQDQGLKAMTRSDAAEVLSQAADLAALGADAAGQALAELGKAVGTKHIIATTVTSQEEEIVVLMRLIDTKSAEVVTRRQTRTSEHDGDLVRAVQAATRLTLAPLFGHLKGKVEVQVSESDANVLMDGQQVGVSPLAPFESPGGFHLLAITKEGFIRHQETLEIGQGDIVQRIIKLQPSPEYLEAYQFNNGLMRIGAWSLSGLAVAALGGWGAFYSLKNSQDDRSRELSDEFNELPAAQQDEATRTNYDQRISDSQNKAQSYGNAATATAVTAIVSAVGATLLWLLGDDPGRYDEFAE